MYKRIPVVALLVVGMLTLACAPKYARQDPVVLMRLVDMRTRTDSFLAQVEQAYYRSEADYSEFREFYPQMYADVEFLQKRADSAEHNEEMQKELELLRAQFISLERIHQMGFQWPEEFSMLKNAFEASFDAIITLEESKPRSPLP